MTLDGRVPGRLSELPAAARMSARPARTPAAWKQEGHWMPVARPWRLRCWVGGQFDRGRLARRLHSDAFSAVAPNTKNVTAPTKAPRSARGPAVRMNSSNPMSAPKIASQIASTGGRRLPGNAIHRAASIHRATEPVYPHGATYMLHPRFRLWACEELLGVPERRRRAGRPRERAQRPAPS